MAQAQPQRVPNYFEWQGESNLEDNCDWIRQRIRDLTTHQAQDEGRDFWIMRDNEGDFSVFRMPFLYNDQVYNAFAKVQLSRYLLGLGNSQDMLLIQNGQNGDVVCPPVPVNDDLGQQIVPTIQNNLRQNDPNRQQAHAHITNEYLGKYVYQCQFINTISISIFVNR